MNLTIPKNQRQRTAGFTMIELVICLGIIAFALVAIIGVLPVGINVQKDNREETIIVQDGMYWMEAIRSGATGLDNLTNHVDYIRIDETSNRAGYRWEPVPAGAGDNHLFLPGGAEIIGLLSMPVQADLVGPVTVKNWPQVDTRSGEYNYIRAKVRAITGSAVDHAKFAREMAFSYRLTSEVRPVRTVEDWAGYDGTGVGNVNRFRKLNFFEVKLTLEWPVFEFGGKERVGPNKRVFRSMVSGRLVNRQINRLMPDRNTGQFPEHPNSPFFFFEPHKFSTPNFVTQ